MQAWKVCGLASIRASGRVSGDGERRGGGDGARKVHSVFEKGYSV